MTRSKISRRELNVAMALVDRYTQKRDDCELFLEQLKSVLLKSDRLMALVHSIKWRTKDPGHLQDKLCRKIIEAKTKGKDLDITIDNLFERVTDLAGIRILHLHTRQFEKINEVLCELFEEQAYAVREGPTAKTWDDESRNYFEKIGVRCQTSDTLYTSVHYVIDSNSRVTYTCEIQVRTLAEELWGEVDHQINYPHECKSVACREQIAALARVTSSCSRLVDSIFRSLQENAELSAKVDTDRTVRRRSKR